MRRPWWRVWVSIHGGCWKPPRSGARGSNMDPAETPTGSWQFDGSATDAPISVEGAEHDVGATASLKALTSDLDFNIGVPEHTEPPPQANGHQGLDLDV